MKVKYSALVSQMSGKLNGSVASFNRGGAYLRNKVTPVNPQTTFQQANRNKLTSFSQQWSALTDAERLSWNNSVTAWAKTDIFGDVRNPSGINLFVKINVRLATAGQAVLTTAPSPASAGSINSLTIVADESASTLVATFTASGVTASETIIVEACEQVSAGTDFVKNKFRVLTTFVGSTASPLALGALYETRFGNMIAGRKIFVRIKSIDNATGSVSLPFVASTIVVA